MSRYIDADALLKTNIALLEHAQMNGMCNHARIYERFVHSVEETPTADVVEVVRCKDCAHYIEIEGFDYNGHKARFCAWHSAYKGENDYCSDGTRRAKKGRSKEE